MERLEAFSMAAMGIPTAPLGEHRRATTRWIPWVLEELDPDKIVRL